MLRNALLLGGPALPAKTETCFGDSGGPLLRVTADVLEVVGVTSRGFPGHSSMCVPLGTVFATFGPETAKFLAKELAR